MQADLEDLRANLANASAAPPSDTVTLQHTCNTLQHTATHCNTLQYTAPILPALSPHLCCLSLSDTATLQHSKTRSK